MKASAYPYNASAEAAEDPQNRRNVKEILRAIALWMTVFSHSAGNEEAQSLCDLSLAVQDDKTVYRKRRKAAFTLAEVLITLGIIGVVAAMTIPTLIQRKQEHEFVNRWFKIYSVLQQAIKLAEDDCGDSSTWVWKTYLNNIKNPDTEGSAYACMKPYLRVVADCPTGGVACFLPQNDDYSTLDNKPSNYCNYYGPALKLATGETLCFRDGSPHIVVDLNGNAKPNKLGVDVQYFSFIDLPTRTFLPGFNWGWRDFADNAEYCNTESGSWHDGASCGFWILRHKNMKYLHMTKEQVKAEWNNNAY